MCSLVSSEFIISLPSSVMVLYSSWLFPLACLPAYHMLLGSIFVLLISSLILFSVCSASYFSIISLVLFCAFKYPLSVVFLLPSSPPLHAFSNSLFASFLSLFAALISSDCVFLFCLFWFLPPIWSFLGCFYYPFRILIFYWSQFSLFIYILYFIVEFFPSICVVDFPFLVKVFFLGLLIFMFVINVLWSVTFLLLPQTFFPPSSSTIVYVTFWAMYLVVSIYCSPLLTFFPCCSIQFLSMSLHQLLLWSDPDLFRCINSWSIFPFLDCSCFSFCASIFSFALKSPPSIISFSASCCVIWFSSFSYISLVISTFSLFCGP